MILTYDLTLQHLRWESPKAEFLNLMLNQRGTEDKTSTTRQRGTEDKTSTTRQQPRRPAKPNTPNEPRPVTFTQDSGPSDEAESLLIAPCSCKRGVHNLQMASAESALISYNGMVSRQRSCRTAQE